MEVGYYKASSNEIARRAGVTWSSISHLFGSREQLMLDVLVDIGDSIERHLVTATIEGALLEDRLLGVLDVFEADIPLHKVQTQILLDLASNPRVSVDIGRDMRRRNAEKFQATARILLTQVLGEVHVEDDVVMYVFGALSGYLQWRELALVATELGDDGMRRELLVFGVAAALRAELERRGTPLNPVGSSAPRKRTRR